MFQKIAIFKALIFSHGHFVFSAGGGGLVFKTTHEVEDYAYEVKDSLGGGGLCSWQRSQVLKWKQLLFALHLFLHSLNCVSFICLIPWRLVTILSFGTYTVHYNFETDNLLSTYKVLSPILSVKSDCISTYLMCLTSTISMLYWCSTGGPGKHPVKSDTIWWQNVFQHGSWNHISQPPIYTDNKIVWD